MSRLDQSEALSRTVIVVGGGIAGISCIEALYLDYNPIDPQYTCIKLVSNTRLVKRVKNYRSRGRNLEDFEVQEEDSDTLSTITPNGLIFEHIVAEVVEVRSCYSEIVVKLPDGITTKLHYDRLCVCTGAGPRMLKCSDSNGIKQIKDRIIVIRDTHSVENLRRKLINCERLVIVGNGGIGLELIHKIADCHKIWIIRDTSIGASYFDEGAAKFLIESWQEEQDVSSNASNPHFECKSTDSTSISLMGPSLGPDWSRDLNLQGRVPVANSSIEIVTDDEVVEIIYQDARHPLKVITENDKNFECDILICAIGVEPNLLKFSGKSPEIGEKSGYVIDNQMRTTLDRVYSAGDVVSCENWASNGLWFQMRLWTQARQMGHYAGRCIAAHASEQDPSIYFNFDCFTHCTRFFGRKLTLLGSYNGQQLGGDDAAYEAIVRLNEKRDYVKILVGLDGRIKGAVLVGESGLEETIENLIHDRLDVSSFKERLLDDTVDIDDYFD